MANPERGEVALTVGDRTYTCVLDFNAQCELEELLSTDDKLVTAEMAFLLAAKRSYRHVRALAWALLRRHHADISVSQVGELIESAGGMDAFLSVLKKARKASASKEGSARPPKARQKRKAGATTTSTRGGSGSRPMTSGG